MEPMQTNDRYAPDAKGRDHVHVMTDRELLEECVMSMRRTQDMVEAFIASMEKNPMMKMFSGKFGK